MKVVIAGSRRLPKGQAPRILAKFIAALPDDTLILLRHPMVGAPSEFELAASRLTLAMHLRYRWCRPEPTEDTIGRASVYVRDIDMVEVADLVVLFFKPDEAADGYSGTAHLLEKSLDAGRPVYAYAVADDGEVERVGEYDPEHLFADIVPAA